MTLKKLNEIINCLNAIINVPFTFNGVTIELNYVARAKHSKNWIFPTHFHPWFEFNYVLKGSLYTKIEKTEFLVQKGQSYIIPPHISHSHRNSGMGDDGLCLRFSVYNNKADIKSSEIMRYLKEVKYKAFDSHIDSFYFGSNILNIQASFLAWLTGIFDNLEQADISKTVQNTFESQVEMYLKENYDKNICVNDIATSLHISYRTLIRRYKNESGYTISDKLTQIRLDNAKKLLSQKGITMSEIAVKTGYENEFYFSKIFKKKEGIPPSLYRKNILNM